MDRMSLLAVDDEVTARVYRYSVGVWIEVFLISHSLVLVASGYYGHVLLQEHACFEHLPGGELLGVVAAQGRPLYRDSLFSLFSSAEHQTDTMSAIDQPLVATRRMRVW